MFRLRIYKFARLSQRWYNCARVPHGSLPPSSSPEKKTVVLDMDQTFLIHYYSKTRPKNYDFIVRPNDVKKYYIVKRPGVEEMLEKLAEKYEVVVFTAGTKAYASLVLDRLDVNRVISHRLYRRSCTVVDGKHVKDLARLGRDLSRVVIVDDKPRSYALQPANGLPIRPFEGDMAGRELGKLVKFSEGEEQYDDIRDAVKNYVVVNKSSSCYGC